jgi:hypothetical protein
MGATLDIDELQQLNTRIVQTIDALNEVRRSVHGLQHANGPASVDAFAHAVNAFSHALSGIGVNAPGTGLLGVDPRAGGGVAASEWHGALEE